MFDQEQNAFDFVVGPHRDLAGGLHGGIKGSQGERKGQRKKKMVNIKTKWDGEGKVGKNCIQQEIPGRQPGDAQEAEKKLLKKSQPA